MSANVSTYISLDTTHRLVERDRVRFGMIGQQSGAHLGEDALLLFKS